MYTSFKYGKQEISFRINDANILGVLEPTGLKPLLNLEGEVRSRLEKPTSGVSLAKIVETRKPGKIVIIVNDLTRSTPTAIMLPPVIEKLEYLGISRESIDIVIATGTHRPMTVEEIKSITGERIFQNYRVTNHDCDAPDLVEMGTLTGGNDLKVNRIVADADLRIAIGEVLLHYYAGFAGGRKSIFPGVAGRETIMNNHRMMTLPGAGIGNISGNPVSDQMIEAITGFCPLHFIINCICNSHKEVVDIVAGDAIEAWHQGIEIFKQMNFAQIGTEADVVFVSAGGFPKDINMYQAHKALEMSSRAVRDGGSIVFFAELAEGYGHPVFEQWADKGLDPEEIIHLFDKDFRFGAHKMYYLAKLNRKCQIYLYSSLSSQDSKKMLCSKVDSLDEIIPCLVERYGENFSSWVIPQGGIVLPVIKQEN